MKLSFTHNNQLITYYVTYKRVKRMTIQVTEDKTIHVTVPLGTPVYVMMNQVKQQADWIVAKLKSMSKEETMPKESIKLLDTYTYAGKSYKLEVVPKSEVETIKVKMLRGKLTVETPTEAAEEIRQAVITWYEKKVEDKMKDRLKLYGPHFKTLPHEIKMTDSKDIIFQANANHLLAHAKLGILPGSVLDYIVVKSLCYINVTSEEDRKQKLAEILPDYEKSQHWLDVNKSKLIL